MQAVTCIINKKNKEISFSEIMEVSRMFDHLYLSIHIRFLAWLRNQHTNESTHWHRSILQPVAIIDERVRSSFGMFGML